MEYILSSHIKMMVGIAGSVVMSTAAAQTVHEHTHASGTPAHQHASVAVQHEQVEQPEQPERPTGVPGARGRAMEVVDLPAPTVSITIEGTSRVIRANGLPTHKTGEFPNRGNPNALRAQNHEVRVPLIPTLADEPIEARPEFGIGLNGVIFDSGTGEFWTPEQARSFGGGSAWNYEALGGGVNLGLDMNHAHVQPTGKYHYHGTPTGLVEELHGHADHAEMVQVGWAFDGFPIYSEWGHEDAFDAESAVRTLRPSYRLKQGERPTTPEGPGGAYDGTFGMDWEYVEGLGDLDECNGRFGVTPEFPQGTYYYVVTEEYPSVPRFWRGEPDESERRRGPGGGPGGGPGAGEGIDGRSGPGGAPGRRPGGVERRRRPAAG